MTPPAVRTVGLSRSHGAVRALDQLTLEIPRGIIFGLLGPNGSGKTATIRLLLGLLAPTSGYAEVLGFDSREHKPAIRQHSGVLLEHCGLYERLTAVNMEALPEDPALLGDIDQETFHRSAVGIADWIRDYLNSPEDHPVLARVSPGDVTAALPAEAPERGEPMAWILADFQRILVAALTHWNHAGFLGYFPSSGSGPGVLAEFLTAAVNQQAMLWRTSPAATELEAVTLGWLRGLLGLPATFEGVTCDGGSASNLHALMAAREAAVPHVRTRGVANRSDVAPLRVYCSNQAHSSIDKAVIVLGQQALRKIPADDHYRLRPESGVDSPRPPMDAGIALGRRFRALQLWMALRYFGSAVFERG